MAAVNYDPQKTKHALFVPQPCTESALTSDHDQIDCLDLQKVLSKV